MLYGSADRAAFDVVVDRRGGIVIFDVTAGGEQHGQQHRPRHKRLATAGVLASTPGSRQSVAIIVHGNSWVGRLAMVMAVAISATRLGPSRIRSTLIE